MAGDSPSAAAPETRQAGKLDLPPYQHNMPPASVTDLRAQIIANASILIPKLNDHTTSDDHLEIVCGKISSLDIPVNVGKLRSLPATAMGQHYALLVRRTHKKEMRVIIKGEPKDTVIEALTWLLEDTEIRIDEMARKYGKDAKGDECCIM